MFMPPPGETDSATQSPSGDQTAPPTGSSKAVSCTGQPPEDGTIHNCGDPLMLQVTISRFTSAERVGLAQKPIFDISETERARSSSAALRDKDARANQAIRSMEHLLGKRS